MAQREITTINVCNDIRIATKFHGELTADWAAEQLTQSFSINPDVIAFRAKYFQNDYVIEMYTVAGDIRIGWVT